MKRRGFSPESIRQIIVDIGPKPNDVTISMENLAAYNRRLIDKTANRYFFIRDPKRITVKGLKIKTVKIPVHPDKKTQFRSFSLSPTFYIDAEDFKKYNGLEVRLKDLCNVRLGETAVFTSLENKPLPKIQWVPAKYLRVRVMTPTMEINGYGEMNIAKEKAGSVVQFERFGFARLEKIQKGAVMAVLSHD